MWTGRAIVQWLAELGIRPGGPVNVDEIDVAVPGDPVPDMPDRLALVYAVPGTGESHEGVLDTPGFQLRLRWDQNDPLGAEQAALMADRLIRWAPAPCWAPGGTWLVSVTRSGGRPTQLGTPVNDGDRSTFTCTYLTRVAEYAHEEMITDGG